MVLTEIVKTTGRAGRWLLLCGLIGIVGCNGGSDGPRDGAVGDVDLGGAGGDLAGRDFAGLDLTPAPIPEYPGESCVLGKQNTRAASGAIVPADPQYTLELTGSGAPMLLPAFDAVAPPEPALNPALTVTTPNAQCPTLVDRVHPAIAIPRDSTIRSIEGYWNGTRLPLLPVFNTAQAGLLSEAHSYGPQMIPFNAPLFSLAALPAGMGTLEIRGYDADRHEIAVVQVEGLRIAARPTPVATDVFAALPHPRVGVTAGRLTAMRAKLTANDLHAQHYQAALQRFLDEYAINSDPNSAAFNDEVYAPHSYLPVLGLCYQLEKESNPTKAQLCAEAGRKLAVKIAGDYSGADAETRFGRDTGYDIRIYHLELMIAYDWLYDALSPTERAQIVDVCTTWVDWYTGHGYATARPTNNYYGPFIQALAWVGVATAGENAAAERLLNQLRDKLATELTIANQQVCGSDWPEGGNYGPDAMTSSLLVYSMFRDYGEDWSSVFEWAQFQAKLYRYQITPNHAQMLSFGGFSGNAAHKTDGAFVALLSTLTATGAHASSLYTEVTSAADNDLWLIGGAAAFELLYGDLTASGTLTGAPLSCYASGSGRFFSKSSLSDTDGYQVAAENMHYSYDHFGYANGDLRFYHGGTCILCSSTYRGDFAGEETTAAFSTYMARGHAQDEEYNVRNNQVLFTKEAGGYSAIAMRFEGSFPEDRFDENLFDPDDALDYLIREAVHVRPGVLVVRDLHRRRHGTGDGLISRFHLGPTGADQGPFNAVTTATYTVGAVSVGVWSSLPVTIQLVDDLDQSGDPVGKRMDVTFPDSTAAAEIITVLSDDGVSITSYAGGLLTLSNGQCVTFSDGDVVAGGC